MDGMIEMEPIEAQGAANADGPAETAIDAISPPPVTQLQEPVTAAVTNEQVPTNSAAALRSDHTTIDSIGWPWGANASDDNGATTWFAGDSEGSSDGPESLSYDLSSGDESTCLVASNHGPAVQRSAGSTAPAERPAARAARKRQRATGLTTHISTLTDLQWLEDVPQAGYTGIRMFPEPLDFETAAALLRDPSETFGKRPDFLEGEIGACLGMVYKEEAAVRRPNKTDLYSFKGSYSNSSKSSRIASTASGEHLHVQRSYGTVLCSRLVPRAPGNQRLKVHQLNFVLVDHDGGSRDLWPRLYHILGSTLTAADEESITAESSVPMDHSVNGVLSLTNAAPDSPWAQFFASDRPEKVVGTLTPSNGGVKLSSTSGDFAEWHPRKDGEPAFKRGDVVAVSDLGLTRTTKGATQLGVVSRQALVEGSVPVEDTKRRGGDTIAYTGRVMIRLRGDCRVGDYLTPSGLGDGTAIASRTMPHACVGRALTSAVAGSAQDVSLIECGVISPPSSVSATHQC